jgi:hypothetical protein
MPNDRNLLSLDASLAIPMRALCFEASQRQRPGRSDHPSWAVRPACVAAPPRRVFSLNFVAQPNNHCKPRELGVASANRNS